jgi:rhombotail lipoprotein
MRPRRTLSLLLLPLLVSFSGCASWYSSRQIHRRSSLLEYLAPHGAISHRGAARLQLPLKIGIAFVPTQGAPLGAESEERLLQIVAKSFTGRDWVGAIRTIPSDYLEPGGGYDNLQQVASLMDVDVVALASVDQIQNNDPTALSILYLSVVGEYIIPGDRNSTHTMIDVGVVDVGSRSFLFRAAGRSRSSGMAAPVDRDRVLRGKSDEGFRRAMVDLTTNLDRHVDDLKASVAAGTRPDVDIITKEGKSVRGGGAFDGPTTGALLVLLAAAFVTCRKGA